MRTITILLMIVLMSATASALGIVPATKELTWEAGKEEMIELMVKNNEKVDMTLVVYAEGEIADWIEVLDPRIDLAASEDSKIVRLKLKEPQTVDKQGLLTGTVVVREVPKNQSGVGAYMAVSAKIKLQVPYHGKYAEINVLVPNFVKGEESGFGIEVNSLGDQDIEEAQAFIDVYGPLNNKLFTLTGDKQRIPAKQKTLMIVKWTPQLNDGPYKAVATLMYDGQTLSQDKTFQLGEMKLDIDSVSVTDFKLGGIAKFDVLVSSNWGAPIDEVYGWVKVSDGSMTYTSYKTASMTVEPYGKQLFQGYWDTQKVVSGAYKLDIMFNYLDKTAEQVYDITVKPNEISIPQTGMAISETQSSTKTSVAVIAAIVLIVLALTIFNSILLWKRLKRKNT